MQVESEPMFRVMGKLEAKWWWLSAMNAAAGEVPSNIPSASQIGTEWCFTLETASTMIDCASEVHQTWSVILFNFADIK